LKNITTTDIARYCGISKATVSRYINGTANVGEKTADCIQEAIVRLNYRPNRIAQGLHTKQSLSIAMVVNDISNPYTATYVKGAEQIAFEKRYNFILCNTGFDPEKEKNYVNGLLEKQIDGIIISPCGIIRHHIDEAVGKGVPVVFITRRVHDIEADYVRLDHADGSSKLIEHLLTLGHRKIAAIGREQFDDNFKNRLFGYQKLLWKHGIALQPDYVYLGSADMQSGYSAMARFTHLSDPPTAVYASTIVQATGVLQYCIEHSIRIPQDLSVVSLESFLEMDSVFSPRLTTYIVPVPELGIRAAGMLFERINGDKQPAREWVITGKLRVSESTAKRLEGDT